MKRVFIVFAFHKDGTLHLHDHPVFTGEIAYDLGGEQDVQECQDLKVREFSGPGEVAAALADYARQHPKEDQEDPGSFVLVERYSGLPPVTAPPKGKTKRAPGAAASKK